MELLSSLSTGITRLREKGGASPKSLYDLVNGFVDQSGAPVSRPGTMPKHRITTLGTKGLTTFKGKLIVFASDVIAPGSAEFRVLVLRHPTNDAATIKYIHYAKPIAGAMYVAAEFSDSEVFHYWLQEAPLWQANHLYLEGEIVQPAVPNGFTYMATRVGPPNPLWAPGVLRTVGDKVEPTTRNGYYYQVTITQGDSPASGQVEPKWIAEDGALVYEDVSGTDPPPDTFAPVPVAPVSPVAPRYSNPGGSRPPTDGRIEN